MKRPLSSTRAALMLELATVTARANQRNGNQSYNSGSFD
jgi:hypothetical protein